ncbi:MAG: type IA DNA topoisomerase [Lachnospiraceae bacterium]|nr:type IA DNA topoisomerase [Lachnospiraceae bacterium]
MKALYIAEKPSVAQEFAKALKLNAARKNGYLESQEAIVTWCVGHLVSMSYPEKYDENLKKWELNTLPFLPETFLYEVIPNVKDQFNTVKSLLNREDIDTIYVCTDSAREGEYIYRLVDMMAGVKGKNKKRVWIDSQTEEEILRGIKDAKDISEYDNLACAAFLRAKIDYLMGINFSRLLTLKYGYSMRQYLNLQKGPVIAVGRVMTCVQGMVVKREREIRDFVKVPFYRVLADGLVKDFKITCEWKVTPGSMFENSPYLYKENGFKEEKYAKQLIEKLEQNPPVNAIIEQIEKKVEKKNPPLLYNLAELQNDCSKIFKISPNETLEIVQELYEKKMVTYPRTDARVLSSAVAKEIYKNMKGLFSYETVSELAKDVLDNGKYKGLEKTRYVNDKQISDHYAIIPTGQGLGALKSLSPTKANVYEVIVRRFLSIFYPPAQYQKIGLTLKIGNECFTSNFKILKDEGYFPVAKLSFIKKKEEEEEKFEEGLVEELSKLKKGSSVPIEGFPIKEGETTPPKRYTSGSLILAMENAGQFIEDEELRAQIKGSGIGTSATRAEIINKLITDKYILLNKKTQVVTPTLLGEMIFDVVNSSIASLLDPKLTASWEKGLSQVEEGLVSEKEYMEKLNGFVERRTVYVKQLNNQYSMSKYYDYAAAYYKNAKTEK